MVVVRFEYVRGLTYYLQNNLHLKPNASEWAKEALGYIPFISVNLGNNPTKCSINFSSEDDALLFYLKFADHWVRPLEYETDS